jgi:hypothetical protein
MHAFMDAAEHLGATWVGFADTVATAMREDGDVVDGRTRSRLDRMPYARSRSPSRCWA